MSSNTTIDGQSAGAPLTGAEIFPAIQSGGDISATINAVKTFITPAQSLTPGVYPSTNDRLAKQQINQVGIIESVSEELIEIAIEQVTDLQTELNGIDDQLDSKLDLTGGTMSGALILNADPIDPLGAATKQYVIANTENITASNGLQRIEDDISMIPTGVTTGTYGAPSKTLITTLNDKGQVTVISTPDVAIPAAQVTDFVDATQAVIASDVGVTLQAQSDELDSIAALASTGWVRRDGALSYLARELLESDISGLTDDLDAKLDIAGGTMTGTLTLNGDGLGALDAVTKQQLDASAAGLNVHAPVQAATLAALTAIYDNGAMGIGATLTFTGDVPAMDGYTLSIGESGAVKNQPAAYENGVYVRTASDVLTRRNDFDNNPEGEIAAGDLVLVLYGDTLAGTQWVQTTPTPIIIGTTPIVFQPFSLRDDTTASGALQKIGNDITIIPVGSAGTVGASSKTLGITTNATGQITALTTPDIAITSTQVTDFATAVPSAITAGVGLDKTGATLFIKNTGVVAGTYGANSKTLISTVNAQGQSTVISTPDIAITSTQITDFATAVPDAITAGTGLSKTSNMLFIANTGVAAGAFGASNKTVTGTLNAQGQWLTVNTPDIAIPSTQVTDFNSAVAALALLKSNNLSDLANVYTALENLKNKPLYQIVDLSTNQTLVNPLYDNTIIFVINVAAGKNLTLPAANASTSLPLNGRLKIVNASATGFATRYNSNAVTPFTIAPNEVATFVVTDNSTADGVMTKISDSRQAQWIPVNVTNDVTMSNPLNNGATVFIANSAPGKIVKLPPLDVYGESIPIGGHFFVYNATANSVQFTTPDGLTPTFLVKPNGFSVAMVFDPADGVIAFNLGTAAERDDSYFLQAANNFSDVASIATALTNLRIKPTFVDLNVTGTVTLANPLQHATQYSITTAASTPRIQFAAANAANSLASGQFISFENTTKTATPVFYADNVTLLTTVYPGQRVKLTVTSNATTNGTYQLQYDGTPGFTNSNAAFTLTPNESNAIISCSNNVGNTVVSLAFNTVQPIPAGTTITLKNDSGNATTLLSVSALGGIVLNGTNVAVGNGGIIVLRQTRIDVWDVISIYEKYTTSGNKFQGVWTPPLNGEYTVLRNNDMITWDIPTASISGAASLATSVGTNLNVPARFCPAVLSNAAITVQSNTVAATGRFSVSSGGIITIFASVTQSNFANTGTAGVFRTGGITWVL